MMTGMFDIYNVFGASEITKNDIYIEKIERNLKNKLMT
jgi:hypothetical protein